MKKPYHSLKQSLIKGVHNKGFTLIELAIVLIIISFMLSMFLGPLSTQREVRAITETRVISEKVREALYGYTIVNRHMPCADRDLPPDGVGDRDPATGNCFQAHGTIPWATLGIQGTDAWGRYFSYRVDDTFSASDDVSSGNLFDIDDGENASGIVVKDAVGGNNLISSGSNPAAIIFSHGANGHGAWTNTGVQLPLPTGADEAENTDGDIPYVSHTPTPEDSANAFDDIMIWISPKVLINRMITAGRLP